MSADRAVLNELLSLTHLNLASKTMNKSLILVELYELLFGKHKIQGSGSVKKFLIAHEHTLETSLSQLLQLFGVQKPQQLLPPLLQDRIAGCSFSFTQCINALFLLFLSASISIPHYIRINTLRASSSAIISRLNEEGLKYLMQGTMPRCVDCFFFYCRCCLAVCLTC